MVLNTNMRVSGIKAYNKLTESLNNRSDTCSDINNLIVDYYGGNPLDRWYGINSSYDLDLFEELYDLFESESWDGKPSSSKLFSRKYSLENYHLYNERVLKQMKDVIRHSFIKSCSDNILNDINRALIDLHDFRYDEEFEETFNNFDEQYDYIYNYLNRMCDWETMLSFIDEYPETIENFNSSWIFKNLNWLYNF